MKNGYIKQITATGGLVAFVAAALVMGSRPATAQSPAGPVPFASVNLQQVFEQYKVKVQGSQEIQALGTGLDSVLRRLEEASAMFLPDNEARELSTLYEKASPSDADKARIGVLEAKAGGLSGELRTLQNVATPNDQQRARLAELTAGQRKGMEVLVAVRGEYRQRLEGRQKELSDKITADMRTAIAKVAKDKNVGMVFDGAVAVYSANDITADVIKELNK